MRKRLCAVILILSLVIVSIPLQVHADSEIIIDSIRMGFSGSFEIIGHLSKSSPGEQVTVLARTEKAINNNEKVTIDNTLWIDQVETGNNGTFLFRFRVNPRFEETDVVFTFGSSVTSQALHVDYHIPMFTISFKSIDNNSVIYGNDAYIINSKYLTSEYVVNSIINGGNIIYFKIGDKWYDLLDKRATSSDFLIESNASDDSEVEAVATGIYYTETGKADLDLEGVA